MSEPETIQPCPFCGKINGQDEMGETYRWRRWRCNECGATGPEVRCSITGSGQGGTKEARELALQEWNDRAIQAMATDYRRLIREDFENRMRAEGHGATALTP